MPMIRFAISRDPKDLLIATVYAIKDQNGEISMGQYEVANMNEGYNKPRDVTDDFTREEIEKDFFDIIINKSNA